MRPSTTGVACRLRNELQVQHVQRTEQSQNIGFVVRARLPALVVRRPIQLESRQREGLSFASPAEVGDTR
jgi:hypothetical protein